MTGMERMRTYIVTALTLCLVGAVACHSEGRNPLIGEWKLVKSDCQVMTQIKYSAKEYSGFETPAGIYPGWRTVAVTYNYADPKEVWILVNGAFSNQTRVFVLDANHIKPDDGMGCVYERVK